MKVRVTKSFPWAQDGNHVRTVKVGEVLEGRGAVVAMQLGAGEALPEQSAAKAPEPTKVSPPQPEHKRGR
jgi:hypothetical protein